MISHFLVKSSSIFCRNVLIDHIHHVCGSSSRVDEATVACEMNFIFQSEYETVTVDECHALNERTWPGLWTTYDVPHYHRIDPCILSWAGSRKKSVECGPMNECVKTSHEVSDLWIRFNVGSCQLEEWFFILFLYSEVVRVNHSGNFILDVNCELM